MPDSPAGDWKDTGLAASETGTTRPANRAATFPGSRRHAASEPPAGNLPDTRGPGIRHKSLYSQAKPFPIPAHRKKRITTRCQNVMAKTRSFAQCPDSKPFSFLHSDLPIRRSFRLCGKAVRCPDCFHSAAGFRHPCPPAAEAFTPIVGLLRYIRQTCKTATSVPE